MHVVKRILRLDGYRLKLLMLYGLYSLPLCLKARFAYRYGCRWYDTIAASDGNRADWELRMVEFYGKA